MNAQVDTSKLQWEQNKPGSWKDPKRYLWLLSPAIPAISLAGLAAYAIAPKKLRALAWTGPALLHGILPALDTLIGEDTSNPPRDAVQALENDKYYGRIVKAYIPTQYAVTFLGAWLATRRNTPMIDRIAIGATVGVVNGIGINTAHELGHKHDRLSRLLSMAALAPTGYTHFAIEHNFGHHKRVATPEDPASSRIGETFWQFLPRSVIGGFKSAVEIEKDRLARKGKSFWSLDNELLQGWAMSAGLLAATTVVCGPRAIPFMIAQGAYGASLLEVVNYLEHYGLKRAKDDSGKYVRTQPEHSWNSNHIMTNLVLYQLQRHSDHHAYPTRSFQALRHFEQAPQLPSGYVSMMAVAYFPNWWFKLMNKRVVEHYKGDMTKANIHPSCRDEIMRQYHRPAVAAIADAPIAEPVAEAMA